MALKWYYSSSILAAWIVIGVISVGGAADGLRCHSPNELCLIDDTPCCNLGFYECRARTDSEVLYNYMNGTYNGHCLLKGEPDPVNPEPCCHTASEACDFDKKKLPCCPGLQCAFYANTESGNAVNTCVLDKMYMNP